MRCAAVQSVLPAFTTRNQSGDSRSEIPFCGWMRSLAPVRTIGHDVEDGVCGAKDRAHDAGNDALAQERSARDAENDSHRR